MENVQDFDKEYLELNKIEETPKYAPDYAKKLRYTKE